MVRLAAVRDRAEREERVVWRERLAVDGRGWWFDPVVERRKRAEVGVALVVVREGREDSDQARTRAFVRLLGRVQVLQ